MFRPPGFLTHQGAERERATAKTQYDEVHSEQPLAVDAEEGGEAGRRLAQLGRQLLDAEVGASWKVKGDEGVVIAGRFACFDAHAAGQCDAGSNLLLTPAGAGHVLEEGSLACNSTTL